MQATINRTNGDDQPTDDQSDAKVDFQFVYVKIIITDLVAAAAMKQRNCRYENF